MHTVCLIIPPSCFLLDERVFMHIGVLKVAAVLEVRGWPVEVLDLSGYKNFEDAVRDHVRVSKAQYFGITATTPQMPAAARIATAIRETRNDAKLVLGGPHATLVVAAKKREEKLGLTGRAHRAYQRLESLFDILVAGDGEEAMFVACREDAPRLIDADDRRSPLFIAKRGGLDALPLPARHLVDVGSYRYTIDGVPALSLIAQLGCPFECGFCAGRLSPMLRHIRTRSSESIVAEMVHIYKLYGHRGFMFYDDELNVNTQMIDLMRKIKVAQDELGVEWRLRGFIKAELFTDEQAQAMFAAGFRWILVGFESGSPRILENINKKATREDNTRCVEIARRAGLKVKALMSLGHPGESPQTAQETLDWLLEVRPDDFDVTIITPYPGSPYYDYARPAEKEGVWVFECPGPRKDKLYQVEVDYIQEADYYKGDPNDGYVSHVYTDELSSQALIHTRDHLERTVREKLNIPFNPSAPALLYEHSMGQSGLPARMLRASSPPPP